MDSATTETQTKADPAAELRAARGRAGLKQEEVAARTGIREARISQIENGGRLQIRAWEIFELEEKLGVPVEVWRHYGRASS